MEKHSVKFHVLSILLLVVAACSLRLFFFSGFVLGDDPAYADHAARIIEGSYPSIGSHATFACRPLLLYAIALPVYLFGWYDWAFVLPVLCASLANTVIVYAAGCLLFGAAAGIVGALLYLTFPLDVVHATTLTNDIVLSLLIWGGGVLLLRFYRDYTKKDAMVAVFLSGAVVGAAVAVKLNALVAPVVFLAALCVGLHGSMKAGGYKTVAVWLGGVIAANAALCLFLYARGGDFFAHYHAEIRFNVDYNPSGYSASTENLVRFLLYYPKLILGIVREGHHGYRFMPYGYFFCAFLGCVPLAFFKKQFRQIRLPLYLALSYLLIMQFMPLKLFPHYIPIHRLPRFLHVASMPAAVTLGCALAACITAVPFRLIKWAAVVTVGVLISSSLYWSYAKAVFYKDCARDQRWAWETFQGLPAETIITDTEMKNYLMFRWGYNPPARVRYSKRLPHAVSPGTNIVLGGSRRPDIYPGYAEDWYENRISSCWQLIDEAPFSLSPWRRSRLRIYYSGEQGKRAFSKHRVSPFGTSKHQHERAVSGFRAVAALDVGDTRAEESFQYRIADTAWTGSRTFAGSEGRMFMDDGRAYRGSESMMIGGLEPNRPLIVIKRLDPGVTRQKVRVLFNDVSVGTWNLSAGSTPGRWHEAVFTIPAGAVTEPDGVLTCVYDESAFDINSFYYWFYQPDSGSG